MFPPNDRVKMKFLAHPSEDVEAVNATMLFGSGVKK